jgi:hypothetical protein
MDDPSTQKGMAAGARTIKDVDNEMSVPELQPDTLYSTDYAGAF